MKTISKFIGTCLLALLTVSAAFAQSPKSGNCTVTAVDESGTPIPGVAVMVKGTSVGAVADVSGKCTLPSVSQGATIIVSCIGYEDAEYKFNGNSIKAVLKASSEFLEDVVVVGYGTQRKKDLTGSVTQVKGDVINEFSNASAAGLLQGRVAGVHVQADSGNPGSEVQVVIRGANSVKGSNAPLWIINGFPGDISMINASDIETIDVLKDASATAIYGSRGANGVIIVTTKSAKDGKVVVEYNGSVGIQSLAKKIEMMDAQDYMLFINEKNAFNGKPQLFSAEEILYPRANTDWQDQVFRNAAITSHSVSARGGNEKFQAALTASYFYQDGIIRNNNYQRYSVNADLKYNPTKWLSIRSNIIVSRIDQDAMSSESAGRETSVTANSLLSCPLASVYNEDGSYAFETDLPLTRRNAVAYLDLVTNDKRYDKNKMSLGLTFKPIEGLSIDLAGNRAFSYYRHDSFTPNEYMDLGGEASVSTTNTERYNLEGLVTYEKEIGKHRFSVMGGSTLESYTSYGVSTGTAKGFGSDVFETYDINAATTKGLPTTSYSNWKILSFLGRLNYNYDDRYLLTVNFRADGSSRFSQGHKWGYFPSFAAAWRISNEDFMKNIRWISNLKLRVGYGQTGSTAISSYQTLEDFSTLNTAMNGETIVCYGTGESTKGTLKWETTAQTNAGIDASFFKNRLNLTVDAYYKKTTDLLCDVILPRSAGYTTGVGNIGSLENKGFEVALDGRILDGPVKWDAGINFSRNRNKVLELANGQSVTGSTLSNTVMNDYVNIVREGDPMYIFYGYQEDGYDEDGRIKYVDQNEDGEITEDDRVVIGNPNPDFLLSFNTSISYKRFTLSAFLQGSFGGDLFSFAMSTIAYDYAENKNFYADVANNYWTPTRTDAKYPAIYDITSYKVSDRYVYDATYVKLKNLELSYDIPFKNPNIQKFIVYVSAQNLLTFTNYPLWDPDVNSKGGGDSLNQGIDFMAYPNARSFTAGVRIKF